MLVRVVMRKQGLADF